MRIHPRCLGCMIDQVRKAYRLLHPDVNNDTIVRTQKKVMKKLLNLENTDAPYYGQAVYQTLSECLGEKDPYAALKKRYNTIALELATQLQELLEQVDDKLLTAITIAIMGNTIDFGTHHSIDIEKDVENFSLTNLGINHYKELAAALETGERILIIGDNAGEIVFDKILMEYLTGAFSEKRFTYAVRGGPAINDALLEDAQMVGLTEVCPVVEGSACPGVIFAQTSAAFQEAFTGADLVLSKGQGNFESLMEKRYPNKEIFFLLKAKCLIMEEIFGVPMGTLILCQQTRIPYPHN